MANFVNSLFKTKENPNADMIGLGRKMMKAFSCNSAEMENLHILSDLGLTSRNVCIVLLRGNQSSIPKASKHCSTVAQSVYLGHVLLFKGPSRVQLLKNQAYSNPF